MPITKCIIPVAGYGTRMLPASKAVPKELFPIAGKPIIQHLVEEAVGAGITDICLITSRQKRAIEDHFDRNPELESALERDGKMTYLEQIRSLSSLANITVIRQTEMRWTGDALLHGRGFAAGEPVLVIYGDQLIFHESTTASIEVVSAYAQCQMSVVGVISVADEQVSRYGIVETLDIDEKIAPVARFLEKPKPHETPSRLANVGRFVLTPDVLDRLAELAETTENETFPIVWTELANAGRFTACTLSGRDYDTGNILGYFEACLDYALADPEYGDACRERLHARL